MIVLKRIFTDHLEKQLKQEKNVAKLSQFMVPTIILKTRKTKQHLDALQHYKKGASYN